MQNEMPHVLQDAFHETVPMKTHFIFVVLLCAVLIIGRCKREISQKNYKYVTGRHDNFHTVLAHTFPLISLNIQIHLTFSNYQLNGKGKAVPLQAWSGPEGSRKLRFPDFMTMAQDGGKVVSLTHRPPLPSGNTPGTHFC